MAGLVRAEVSKKKLKFIPGSSFDSPDDRSNDENEFEVTVINDSDKFASFQLQLEVLREDLNILTGSNGNGKYNLTEEELNYNVKWYSIQPEMCAKKPPGSLTKFHIAIVNSPVPVYDTTIDLLLRVFSVEDAKLSTSQKLTLQIDKPRKSFRIFLPIKEFKLSPGETSDIPVVIENYSSRYNKIALTLSNLESSWVSNGNSQTLVVEPGISQEIYFRCQPPESYETVSQEYKFLIEGKSLTVPYTTRDNATLKVLPQGFVEFTCPEKEKTIPVKNLREKNFVTYSLKFENKSNLFQQIDNIDIDGDRHESCEFSILEEEVDMLPGETGIMQIQVKKNRPWLGRKRKFLFQVSPILAEQTDEASKTIQPSPNTRVLQLNVLPIIPFLVQLGLAFLIPLLLLSYWWTHPQEKHAKHAGPVNSVRLVGYNRSVLSGSSDRTIKLWQIDTNPSQSDSRRLKYEDTISGDIPKAVRVIRQSPKDDDLVAAGLDNGKVKLWNLSSKLEKQILSAVEEGDRVFDLAFTKNAGSLFSGHGSGTVYLWNVYTGSKFKWRQLKFKQAIYSLALNESQQQPIGLKSSLFIAGQYNTLAVWDWRDDKLYRIDYQQKQQPSENPSRNDYINSLAIANNTLAAGDSQGNIKVWDINQLNCRSNTPSKNDLKTSKPETNQSKQAKPQPKLQPNNSEDGECQFNNAPQTLKDKDNNEPVRSIALTQDGNYLSSVGDDGKVKLWDLKGRSNQSYTEIDNLRGVKLNSVDVKALKDASGSRVLLIAVGDDKNYVRLYRKGV